MLHAEMLVNSKDGKVLPDNAYSAILGYLPNGLIGLSLAALTAAIVASLAGKANSISTIFTLDVYKKYIKKDAEEKNMVWVGRITILVALFIAILFTWTDILGIGGAGGFTYIQKYTGFISPGVFAMFILGMFWKRTTGAAAVVGVVTGFGFQCFSMNLPHDCSAPKLSYTQPIKMAMVFTKYLSISVWDWHSSLPWLS